MNVDLGAWLTDALKVLDEPRGVRARTPERAAQAQVAPPRQPVAPQEIGSPRIPAAAPEGFSHKQWTSIRAGAEVFIHQWGDVATFLGWTEAELFGLDAKAPAALIDK